jgi:hypothetical protein
MKIKTEKELRAAFELALELAPKGTLETGQYILDFFLAERTQMVEGLKEEINKLRSSDNAEKGVGDRVVGYSFALDEVISLLDTLIIGKKRDS